MLLYFIIFLSCIYFSLSKIVKTSVYINTRNLLISTNNYKDNNYKLYWDICKLISKTYFQLFLQTFFSSIKKSDEWYEISYYYGSTKYLVPLKVGKAKLYPIKIDFYTNIGNTQHEINTAILPYAGPNYNFHNLSLTPNYFSLTNLIVKIDDNIYKIFKEKDIISISI